MIRLLDGVDAGARLTTRAPSTTGTRRAVTQMTRWWLGGLALSKAQELGISTLLGLRRPLLAHGPARPSFSTHRLPLPLDRVLGPLRIELIQEPRNIRRHLAHS